MWCEIHSYRLDIEVSSHTHTHTRIANGNHRDIHINNFPVEFREWNHIQKSADHSFVAWYMLLFCCKPIWMRSYNSHAFSTANNSWMINLLFVIRLLLLLLFFVAVSFLVDKTHLIGIWLLVYHRVSHFSMNFSYVEFPGCHVEYSNVVIYCVSGPLFYSIEWQSFSHSLFYYFCRDEFHLFIQFFKNICKYWRMPNWISKYSIGFDFRPEEDE